MTLGTRFNRALIAAALLAGGAAATAATKDLGNGFADHGVCVPAGIGRGTVAAKGADGQDVMLVQLSDARGTYGVFKLDMASGKSSTALLPIEPNAFHNVFASLYSRKNRFYAHHSSHLTEYDPVSDSFTFVGKTHPGMGMGMTETAAGVIWTVTYPDSGVLSYDPATGAFKDYGSLNKENWAQYPRTMAADDRGWIYWGIGQTKAQVMGFHPGTGEVIRLLDDKDRPVERYGMVFQAAGGKVYATFAKGVNYHHLAEAKEHALKNGSGVWYELSGGKITKLAAAPVFELDDVTAGTQSFSVMTFKSGREVQMFNLVERAARAVDPATGKAVGYKLDYACEGAHVSSLVASPSHKILTGGSSFPMRNYVYDPAKDTMIDRNGSVQWNTVLAHENHIFVGAYNGGFFLDWNLDKPYSMPRSVYDAKDNPRCVAGKVAPEVIRPHTLKLSADGRYLLMGGTPEYGRTGGGMGIWDREKDTLTVLTNAELIADHAIYSLAVLPDGRIFGGTTTEAGTGGEAKAKRGTFFEFDLATRKIVWQRELFADARTYHDLTVTPDGRIMGIVDNKKLFLFDPATRSVVAESSIAAFGGAIWQQGPRMFVRRGDEIYILCKNDILKVDPVRCEAVSLVKTPVGVTTGGDVLDDRLYFVGGTRLYSYRLPPVR